MTVLPAPRGFADVGYRARRNRGRFGRYRRAGENDTTVRADVRRKGLREEERPEEVRPCDM
jgi:hypothetical protein